jgi:hypothetical protein
MLANDEDLDFWSSLTQEPRGIEAARPRHAHVEKNDVGVNFISLSDRLVGGCSFSADDEVFFSRQKLRNADPNQAIVIGN